MKSQHALDRASPIPAYSQIANLIRRRIADGEYRPGDAIPPVSELSTSLGVASMTVRQAIAQLGEEGLVVRRQGRGTFVLPPNVGSAKFSLDNLTQMLSESDLAEKTLSVRQVKASELVAEKLRLEPGVPVTAHRRLLVRQGKPVFYQSRYVRADADHRFDDVEADPDALRGLFIGYGEMGIKNGIITLNAATLAKREAELLGGKPGAAAWSIEYVYFDFNDTPVIWGHVICQGEVLSFSAPVGISENNGLHRF